MMSSRRQRPRRRDEFHDRKQDMLLAWSDEVCNSEEVPEVEIVSLLQEHIPKYRLRADSLTQFGGYENQDWFIPSPALPVSDEDLQLTSDQIRETLNYFLLCSNRVSQMTKTYNDIEAVTRLLEEKEKDLELTARIGKELLAANGRLEARVGALEGELRGARDVITQLRHELHTKSDLLQVLTNDSEESPVEEVPDARVLHVRTGALERENRALREEAARLAAGADDAEQAERRLLADIAHQLAQANAEANVFGSELANERERANDLQEQLESSNKRLAITERSLQQLTAEHEHTLRILEITKENQNALAAELADTKERYAEVAALLAELQATTRALRRRAETTTASRGLMPHVAAAAGLTNTLHTEMHSSVFSELSLDSGIGDQQQMSSMQKVFETVQCASRWSEHSSGKPSILAEELAPPRPVVKPMSARSDDSVLGDSCDSDSEDYPGGWGGSGVPGAPGAAELAAALRRLSPRDIDARRALLTAAHAPNTKHYSDSIMSSSVSGSESAVWGVGAGGVGGAAGAGAWRRGRLQIVKPMEGSLTLHTWAQLAKPTMSNLLEEQEGVGVRGLRTEATRAYRLSDVEEDDDLPRFPYAAPIYTYTDSTVLHPNDGSMCGSAASSGTSSLASSVLGSAWSSLRSSRRSSLRGSRRTSAAGSPARRASVAPTPARRYSPTATPANSPLLGSPEPSPPASPAPSQAPSLHSLIAIGRKYLASPAAADAAPSPLTLQTPGSLYTGLVHRSPMEQLTCLKRTLRSPGGGGGAADPPAPASPLAAVTPGAPRSRARAPRPRTDLGTVGGAAPAPSHSPLGTISTFLFGRKGGLL